MMFPSLIWDDMCATFFYPRLVLFLAVPLGWCGQAIAEALKANTSVAEIWLENNKIGDDGAKDCCVLGHDPGTRFGIFQVPTNIFQRAKLQCGQRHSRPVEKG